MQRSVVVRPRACERRASSRERARASSIDPALAAVARVRVARGGDQGSVKVGWDAIATKKAYVLERAPRREGPWTLVHVGRRASVEIDEQPTLSPLWFRVTATFADGKAAPFSEPVGIVLPGPDWYDAAFPAGARQAIARAKALIFVEPMEGEPTPLKAEQQIARIRQLAALVADNTDVFPAFPAQPVEMFRMADEMERTHLDERSAHRWLVHVQSEARRAEAQLLLALERQLEQTKPS